MLFCSANLLKNIVILRANLYQEILIDTRRRILWKRETGSNEHLEHFVSQLLWHKYNTIKIKLT